jgi:hypothetical protein
VKAITIPHICLASPDEPTDILEQYFDCLKKEQSKLETLGTMFHGWMGARANLHLLTCDVNPLSSTVAVSVPAVIETLELAYISPSASRASSFFPEQDHRRLGGDHFLPSAYLDAPMSPQNRHVQPSVALTVKRSPSFEGLLPGIASPLAAHLAPPLRLFEYFPFHTTNQDPPLLHKPILCLPAPYIPGRP